MIDTDKYEGHTPGPWVAKHDLVETEAKYGREYAHIINSDGWRVWLGESADINDEPRDDIVHTTLLDNTRFGSKALGEADAKLIAAAPDLLAEVKELRAWKKLVSVFVQQQDGSHLREMLKELIE